MRRRVNFNRPARHGHARTLVQGVSLIEVLVAMLIVSLGVLAVAGLLATASRYGKTSEYRAMATLLASDYVDRVRANKPAVTADANVYNLINDYASWAAEPANFEGCGNRDDCTPQEIAAQDRAEWGQAVFNTLPGGAAFVQLNGDPKVNPTADVWIAWLDPDADSEGARADGEGRNECPVGFREGETPPRCAYFRVGL